MVNVWWKMQLNVSSKLEETLFWKFDNLGIKMIASRLEPSDKSKTTFIVWLPINEWNEQDLDCLYKSLIPFANEFGVEIPPPKLTQVFDEDWSISWKKHWKPDPVGNNFLILPAWMDIPKKDSSRVILRLDPGSAFGTGSHPTTRLCLEAIERTPLFGKTIGDIGCGSGILSLAALKKGASQVFACDTDSLAVSASKDNFTLNNIDKDKVKVILGSMDELELNLKNAKLDVLMCNILLPTIKDIAPKFTNILQLDGIAILSGILLNQITLLEENLKSLGWKKVNHYEKEKWASFIICRE